MERKLGKYKTKPNAPKQLNDKGKSFWDLYCYFLLERNVLEGYLIPTLTDLCVYEQEKVSIQQKLTVRSGDEDLHKTLNTVVTKIRQLRDDLGIYLRKNEMYKPESEKENTDENKDKKDTKIHQLKAKNW